MLDTTTELRDLNKGGIVTAADEVAALQSTATRMTEAETNDLLEMRKMFSTATEDARVKLEGIHEQLLASPHVHTRPIQLKLKEVQRQLRAVEAASDGTIDLTSMLSRKFAMTNLNYPARTETLAKIANKRMAKSKYAFPCTLSVLQSIRYLRGENEDSAEMCMRVAYFLSVMNMLQHGTAMSTACRRLIEAAMTKALMKRDGGKAIPADRVKLVTTAINSLDHILSLARKEGSVPK